MKRFKLAAIGGVLILVFAGFSLASFKKSLTPYVSYEQARSVSRTVQVAGGLVQGSSSYDKDSQSLLFTLQDQETGDSMQGRYHGVKPGNFEDALSIVAIGTYDRDRDELAAQKLLVKCPSKYQGAEVKEYGS